MHLRSILAAALLTVAFTDVRADDPATFDVGALKFQRPASWSWIPVNSPMRKAQLKIAGKEKDQAADITFFHFGPGSGGGVDANAKRWIAQFQSKEGAAKVEPQQINGTKVTVVSTEGAFNSGMPGGPTTTLSDYGLLGAIIENPEGDVFVKMTGPAALVKEQHKAFMDFIASAVAPKK
ncbi:MAG: hypothetical protein JWL90_917 [Chthoniobacteraceae bacterium]|nr:hypothetical protein [Chthoniobacteraceae bacterium]MDB6173190.1 hypothetical protein [Chthoniobacteraceae bacterium]